MDEHYQEAQDLLGVVRGYMACNSSISGPITDVEIQHYIDLAREYRVSYKKEKAREDGRRSESVCVWVLFARASTCRRGTS